ncbi:MAG: putative ral secretion pathway protein component of type secretion system [Pseudomonadota bacterium]|jgi:type II secretion system protein L
MLIVALPDISDIDAYDHVQVGEDARPIGHGMRAAADLPPGQLVAVVPISRLSWHSVRLPLLPKAQRIPAVVGLLEDQWLQSPSSLHITLHPIEGATDEQDNHWVGVCDALWLSQVLQPLIDAGRMPQHLWAEWAPLPPGQADTLHVWGQPEEAMLTWCSPQGVMVSRWPAPWPLLQSTPVTPVAEPKMLELVQNTWPSEPGAVRTQTRYERWLAASQSNFDLAQGVWSQTPAQRWRRRLISGWRDWAHQPRWRWMRRAVAVMLAAQTLGLLSWAWWTEQTMARQKSDLAAMLIQAFPQTQLVIDPAAQMDQALHALRRQVGAESPDHMEVMLGHLTQALGHPPNFQALLFENSTLTVKGLKLDAIEPKKLQALRQMGYELKPHSGGGLVMRWSPKP